MSFRKHIGKKNSVKMVFIFYRVLQYIPPAIDPFFKFKITAAYPIASFYTMPLYLAQTKSRLLALPDLSVHEGGNPVGCLHAGDR
jgi:hypothetical protein